MTSTSASTTPPRSPTSNSTGLDSGAGSKPPPCRPLRILFISDDPEDATVGAVKAELKLAAALRALGHTCHCLFRNDLAARPENERLRWPFSPWWAWRAAARAWRRSGPYDVIDAAGAEGWVLGLARRWGAFPGAVVVARSHGLDHFFYQSLVEDGRRGLLYKPWWRRWWFPLTRLAQVALNFRLADGAVMINTRERALALNKHWLRPERVALIVHGVDPERWVAAPAEEAPRGAGILFNGTWYTGKGNVYLAEAHRLLLRRGLAIPLTIFGPGIDTTPEAIEAYVRAGFAPECQAWLTVIPRTADEDEVYRQYACHDLLVCPSTAEGFGMVVLEAMSQRLPVICTSAVGAAELLHHGDDAWIVPPRDAAALADAIELLWRDPALRRRLAERAHTLAGAYPWRRAAEQTAAFWRSLQGRSAG